MEESRVDVTRHCVYSRSSPVLLSMRAVTASFGRRPNDLNVNARGKRKRRERRTFRSRIVAIAMSLPRQIFSKWLFEVEIESRVFPRVGEGSEGSNN